MQRRQTKRTRPTLQTAHEWLKAGCFRIGPEDFVSDQEREKEIEESTDRILHAARQHFPRTQKIEYAILKMHLIIEFAVSEYIRAHSHVFAEVESMRFSFSDKLEIAYLMGLGVNDPVLLPTINLLNRSRNEVAHKFTFNRDTIREMATINGWNRAEVHTDRQIVSALRKICYYICGCIAGQIEGRYYATKYIWDKAKQA
jgi:hypothetical protein